MNVCDVSETHYLLNNTIFHFNYVVFPFDWRDCRQIIILIKDISIYMPKSIYIYMVTICIKSAEWAAKF